VANRRRRGTGQRFEWSAAFSSPLLHQIVALVIAALGVITLLGLFNVTRGLWVETWTRLLRYWFGWGSYCVAGLMITGALLWLGHYLDRPIGWRWRPFVGAELSFFALLALTHVVGGRDDPWVLVEAGWGGGLVGWAIATTLIPPLGFLLTGLLLAGVLACGWGLAFDFTFADMKGLIDEVQRWREGERIRISRAGSPSRSRPPKRHASSDMVQRSSAVRSAQERGTPSMSAAERVGLADKAGSGSGKSGTLASVPSMSPAVLLPPSEYSLPSVGLLEDSRGPAMTNAEIAEKSRIIEQTLSQFGLPVSISEVRVGPAVAQFGLKPGYTERSGRRHKVRVSQISSLANDLALALSAPRIRVEAPVPGRGLVGIEVPNERVELVGLREVMESDEFARLAAPLAIALGRDVAGKPIAADLAQMPHLLIAGTTGSGKSVSIKAITACLVTNNTPDQLRLVLIDPKMVELVAFNGLPHVYGQVEFDLERIVRVLHWVAWEMNDRYKRFAAEGARNIDDYNRAVGRGGEEALGRIVVLIDELADLMMIAPDEVERTICRIAQMARATGIHLVVATQRPSVDVVTGLIKANFPARVSFATASQTDSRVILDMPGAETLMGKGDMLYLAADAGYPVRLQGCFITQEEVGRIVTFWRDQVGYAGEEAPWERMMRSLSSSEGTDVGVGSDRDELLPKAVELVRESGSASASLLQRKLRIGHPRAARLMAEMEGLGVIGPPEAAGRTRRVLPAGVESLDGDAPSAQARDTD
jgi:S-DNA-T family DNA segregation ATPase FtsK/SpoIIIE